MSVTEAADSAAGSVAEASQQEALEASGWGVTFKLVQPRNAAFWVFLWGMTAGTLQMLQYYGPRIGIYGVGLGTGVLEFAVYTIPWLLLLAYHNRYTKLPGKLLVVAFAWTAVAGTFWMGLQANTAVLSVYSKLFGKEWNSDWGAGLTAPFTEEAAKASALILLIGLAPRIVRSVYDGLIIGAYAGLGLQISEDVLYAFNGSTSKFGTDQVGEAFGMLVSRGPAGLFQHVLFSAVFCAGLMWLIGRDQGRHRLRGLLLMLFAMVVHSCWDNLPFYGTSIAGGAGTILLLIGLPVVELIVLAQVFRWAAPQEQAWMRALLGPEVDKGVLSEAEVDAFSGGRKARKAFLKDIDGHHDTRTAKHVLGTIGDLAEQLADARGTDSPGVLKARSEVARVRGA